MAHVDNVWTGYRQLMPPATRSFALCRPAQGNGFDTPSFNHSSACPKIENPHKIIETLSFSFTTHLYHGYIMVFKPHFPISGHKLSRQTKFSESTPSGRPRRCFPRFQDRTGMAWPWGNPGDIGYPWISGDPDVKKPLVGGFGYSNCRNMK